jgi:hypothetical protein
MAAPEQRSEEAIEIALHGAISQPAPGATRVRLSWKERPLYFGIAFALLCCLTYGTEALADTHSKAAPLFG